MEMMEELTRHGYKLSPGTLYPILHDLVDAGFLRPKSVVIAGKCASTAASPLEAAKR